MAIFRDSALYLGLSVVVAGAVYTGCSSDAADKLGTRGGPGGTAGSSGAGGTGSSGSGGPGSDGTPPEEALFRALQPDLLAKCGKTCHETGDYKPTPPTFLAPPDPYVSIKAHPGIVVADTYTSLLLTKGPHAGPAISEQVDPDFYNKVKTWLDAEALVINSAKKPAIDPIAVVNGANDIDMTKACTGGLTGVHMKFDASLVGTSLAINNIRVVAPAGTDVHVLHPLFYRVTGTPAKQIADSADSFSNTDQTVPGGAETALTQNYALFTSPDWSPFDFGADKIVIQVDKLEPGKVSVLQGPVTCKDPATFATAVLPSLRGGNGFTPNCSSCHGAGLANLTLNGNDNTAICNSVIAKLNKANIAQSIIVTHLTTGAGTHGGGAINNATNWTNLWVNNAGVFF